MQKAINQPVADLDIGEPPQSLVYLWNAYAEVRRGVEGKMTYSDVNSYCSLFNCSFEGFEIKIFLELDGLYWSISRD